MLGNNSVGRSLKFISFKQVADLRYCTLYEKKDDGSNVTDVVKYIICYSNEICCDHGNGCCPARPAKYYESWCFWIFVFGIILACYLLCWYCKKIEKERQAVRVNVRNDRNPPRMIPCLRPVDAHSVDHLLETLILNYRNRLVNQSQPTQNEDVIKVLDNTEAPPEYTDALKMPKPPAHLEDSSVPSNNASDDNSVTLDIIDDDPIPSYEEAIKKL